MTERGTAPPEIRLKGGHCLSLAARFSHTAFNVFNQYRSPAIMHTLPKKQRPHFDGREGSWVGLLVGNIS